jgi:hypothetical protein
MPLTVVPTLVQLSFLRDDNAVAALRFAASIL